MTSRSKKSPSSGTEDLAGAASSSQRIDKWLWYARVAKSRTLAADLVQAGRVRVNRLKTDKPSATVKIGDVVTITVRGRVRILRVDAAGTRRGPASEAQSLYEDLTPSPVGDPAERPLGPAGNGHLETAQHPPPTSSQVAQREPGSGRPTKRDRRALDRIRNGKGQH